MMLQDVQAPDAVSRNKVEAVSRHIRDRILSLEYPPGSFIDKAAICALLGVSRQPVTAALTQLAREGLVEILPQRGSYVTRLDPDFLKERLFVRAALEAALAAELALAPPAGLTDRLRQIIAEQRDALERGDHASFLAGDELFHRTLTRTIASEAVRNDIETGLMCTRRVFTLTRAERSGLDHVPDELAAIVKAIENGDHAGAAALILDQNRRFADFLATLSREHPAMFRTAG
jgi:DNA-binding GntR family transcriptional regulator